MAEGSTQTSDKARLGLRELNMAVADGKQIQTSSWSSFGVGKSRWMIRDGERPYELS